MKQLCVIDVYSTTLGINVKGSFVINESDLPLIVGKELYLDEVEDYFCINNGDIDVISVEQEHINWIQHAYGGSTIYGVNPLDYV